MSKQLFICDCSSPEHQFIIEPLSDEEPLDSYLMFYIHLTPLTFWRRVVTGLKYVFGSKNKYAFEDVLLQRPEVTRLRDALNKFLVIDPINNGIEHEEIL